jgi:exonuclease SbcC
MKILAIRGAGLASLEGEFELALSAPPLAEAGVFAICGPTGAGKSTLLDAMCVALFDTVPRLDGASRTRVGRAADDDRITGSDPRSLLRKGSGEGWAEVDFRGVDGRLYRARWEVWRSRRRPDGKLQASAMALTDLVAEQPIGQTKTEVKQAVVERLGLTFEQFRRSVLLAQNDFAAFLDAEPKARAALLERMTGTEIYGRVSVEAYRRVTEERAKLAALEGEREAVPSLSVEERARLDGEVPGLALRTAEEELAWLTAAEALRWHHGLTKLRDEEREAREELARTERQLALVETRRRELEAAESVRALRPLVDAVDGARADLEAKQRALPARAEAAEAAEGAREAAARRAKAAQEAVAAAEAAEDDSRPVVQRARDLDAALARLLEEQEGVRRAEEVAEAARKAAEAKVARVAAALDELDAEDRGFAAQLDAEAPLVEVLPAVPLALAQLSELASLDLPGREAAHAAAVEAEEKARAAVAEARRSSATAQRGREAAEETLATRRAMAAAQPSGGLAALRDRWVERRSALDTLHGVAARVEAAHGEAERHAERAEAAALAEAEAVAREGTLGAAVLAVEARASEAEGQLERTKATVDLAARRGELLQDGQACPLCGSETHPFAAHAPVVDALLAEQRERRAALRAEETALREAIATARARVESERRAAEAARAEHARWSRELADLRDTWRRTAAELGDQGPWPEELPERPGAPSGEEGVDWGPLFSLSPRFEGFLDAAARAGLDEAREEARRRLAELASEEHRRRGLEAEVEAARTALDGARRVEAEARTQLEGAERTAEAAKARGASTKDRRDTAATRRRELDGALRAGLGEVYPGPDAEGFGEALRGRAEALVSAQGARRALAERRAAKVPLRVRAEAEQAATVERAEEQRLRREALAAREGVLRAERRGLLGGRPTGEVEAALRGARQEARAEARRAEAALLRARTEAEKAAREREEARAEGARAQAALAKAQGALRAALEDAGVDEATARARLQHDPAELEAWRRELADLDETKARQSAVVVERTRRREAHEAADSPRLDEAAAEAELAQRRARHEEAREAWTEARARLSEDDAHRSRAAVLDEAIARGRAQLATWETLADLIGSASGSKLRVFAQSLTLDLLLGHANQHLRDLAPRYGLMRVPGEDLALQVVDHAMGDEVRAVRSLSGGESFLVALGLALGLASLSAQDGRVDSLFIDEGFGALDPESLEVVLAALDRLQATGRQVGLISHVQTVAERFGTRVAVQPAGPARSRVQLVAA